MIFNFILILYITLILIGVAYVIYKKKILKNEHFQISFQTCNGLIDNPIFCNKDPSECNGIKAQAVREKCPVLCNTCQTISTTPKPFIGCNGIPDDPTSCEIVPGRVAPCWLDSYKATCPGHCDSCDEPETVEDEEIPSTTPAIINNCNLTQTECEYYANVNNKIFNNGSGNIWPSDMNQTEHIQGCQLFNNKIFYNTLSTSSQTNLKGTPICEENTVLCKFQETTKLIREFGITCATGKLKKLCNYNSNNVTSDVSKFRSICPETCDICVGSTIDKDKDKNNHNNDTLQKCIESCDDLIIVS
jgi:hypothetical protein